MGIGNFFGLLPESLAGAKLYGVELDSLTGRIARQLYQKADITVGGFETTNQRDFYDLAVGNVPFGQYHINDPAYNRLGFNIHNYFFAKALDQVRPGGIVAFVTSRYTMDAKDSTVRKYLAERADLLGAIRLPSNAFKANAGTEVVSDIIFLQKRDRPAVELPSWVGVGENDDGFKINHYFLEHPDMVLGTPTSDSTQYGRQDYTVAPIEGADLSQQLAGAIQNLALPDRELLELGAADEQTGETLESIPADPSVRNFSYTLYDGKLYFRENSRMTRVEMGKVPAERVKGMIAIRDSARRLIDLQLQNTGDDEVKAEQAKLNRLYDQFTKKYGLLNSLGNKLAFEQDSAYPLLCSLEVLDDEGMLMSDPVKPLDLGEYRGFPMQLHCDGSKFKVTMKQHLTYTAELSDDPVGNVTRINNALEAMAENLKRNEIRLTRLESELKNAQEEAERPFPKEEELRQKSARLTQLNRELEKPRGKEANQHQNNGDRSNSESGEAPGRENPVSLPTQGNKPSIREAIRAFTPPAPVSSSTEKGQREEAAL